MASKKGKWARKQASRAAKASWAAWLRRRERVGKRNAKVNLMRSTHGVDKKTAKLHVKAGTSPSGESAFDVGIGESENTIPGKVLSSIPLLGWAVDWGSEWAERGLDEIDLRRGKITLAELEQLEENPHLVERWRSQVRSQRASARASQREARAPGEWRPAVTDFSFSDAEPVLVSVGFTPPPARKGKTKKKDRTGPATVPQPRRPHTRRVDRPSQLRRVWGKQFEEIKERVMAEPNLASAVSAMRSFADSQPRDRSELHAHLAAFAALGDEFAAMCEAFQANLERPLPDGSPGVPPEVTSRLAPVPDAGREIARAAQDTSNAFEDRFAEAIRVAQDEQKMSDAYLKQPA